MVRVVWSVEDVPSRLSSAVRERIDQRILDNGRNVGNE
jgi:hypothetical protein